MSDLPPWLTPILGFLVGAGGVVTGLKNGAVQRWLAPAQRRQMEIGTDKTRLDALGQATAMLDQAITRIDALSAEVQTLKGKVARLEEFVGNVHHSAARIGVDVSTSGVLSIHPGAGVLVVDDDEDIAAALQQLLEAEGYAACATGTVADATALAARQPFAVAIIDLYLGQQTALDLVTALRALPTLKQLQVVISTAARTSEAGTKHLITTIDPAAVLEKPWDADRVLAVVRTVLAKRESTG